jgi:large subunit ribosomal protein L24
MEIKKGDNVVVIAGKDKGKKGKVLETSPKTGRLVVENVNIVTKHKKPRSAQDKGGIVKQTNPIDRSNVMVVCPVCEKATRIANKELKGNKVRICKKCGASLDKEFVKTIKKEAKKAEVKAEVKAKEEVKETKSEAKKSTTSKPRVNTASTKAVKATKATATKTAKQQKIGSKGQ